MQARSMLRPLCSLWLLAVMLLEWTSADDSIFCDRPANMELCLQGKVMSKRFLRFGRALTDDPFLRFGRSYMGLGQGNVMDKRFLRFGRSGGEPTLDDVVRLALARAQVEDSPLYRKKRSVAESPEAPSEKAIAPIDHPEGVAKREATDNESPIQDDKRFMRFGKRFMRFGRSGEEDEDNMSADKRFMRFGKRFMRFGKSGQEMDDSQSADKRFMRFGKRFMRFGKRDGAEEDQNKSEQSSS
ncbi:FMRFamide neuropeptides-like [Littorina saxatilis]|uniref:FMRFamide neuropeptides-like n=1 Tax=Littorina saxatilis TaxID=31220 RepID=UPI0038B5367D